MGQSMQKLAVGNGEQKKAKEIGPIIEQCYEEYFKDTNECNFANFYHAVSQTVEKLNSKVGGTQLRMPSKEVIERAFRPMKKKVERRLFFWTKHNVSMIPRETPSYEQEHHKEKEKELTKDEFGKILQDVILSSGIMGTGATEILYYIFGIPATALFLKKGLFPKLVPNDIFIPGVTSATVFVLAKLNKI